MATKTLYTVTLRDLDAAQLAAVLPSLSDLTPDIETQTKRVRRTKDQVAADDDVDF